MLQIVQPTKENLKKTIQGLTEIKTNPTPYDLNTSKRLIDYMEKNFEGYLDFIKKQSSDEQPEGWVPTTTLFLFDDDQFIGIFDLRHGLTEMLSKRGGHIAYEIIPSKRRQGYGKAGLKLVIQFARQHLNIKKILVTCHGDNLPSHKMMLSVMRDFGGEIKEDILIDGHIEKGVWINAE